VPRGGLTWSPSPVLRKLAEDEGEGTGVMAQRWDEWGVYPMAIDESLGWFEAMAAAISRGGDAHVLAEDGAEAHEAGEARLLGDFRDGEGGFAQEFGGAVEVNSADFVLKGAAHDPAKAALEVAAAHDHLVQDVVNADLFRGMTADEAGGFGDDFVFDAEHIGGMAGDDAAGWDFDGGVGDGFSLHQIVEHFGGLKADAFDAELDAGECWADHFGEEGVVVDAEHGDFFGDGDVELTANIDGVPGVPIVGGEDGAGPGEGCDPFAGDFVGVSRGAEGDAFAAALAGEGLFAEAGPGDGGVAAECEGAEELFAEIFEGHFTDRDVVGEDGGDMLLAELPGGDGAGGVDGGDSGAAKAVETFGGVDHGDDAVDVGGIEPLGIEGVHGRHEEFPVGAEVSVGHDAAQDATPVAPGKVDLYSYSNHAVAAKRLIFYAK
jgi:hypothetical protein